MKTIFVDKVPRIIKLRKKLEKALEVKITNTGKQFAIKGTPEKEYLAEKVIEALDFGFPLSEALLIKEESYMFEIINIKHHTKRKDLERIKARIIGTKGKTLKTLTQLTKCFFELKDNRIGIVGDPEYIENAQNAIIQLIQGSKQGNVYSYLEKHQVEPVVDLGLKEPKNKE
jgi:KH domain-containing protein